jgi:Homeodomain-like domain
VYDITVRERALELLAQGLSISEVSRRTHVSRAALSDWRRRADQGRPLFSPGTTPCPRCDPDRAGPVLAGDYAYLLGLYLGDGCVSPVSDPAKRVWALRVFCADAYPGLIAACGDAMRAVRPGNRIRLLQLRGCTEVNSQSKHWPCLLPQHGPGKKHARAIRLQPWQEKIVHEFTGHFVRGLIHSDGSRSTNRVRHGERCYEYPRYFFTNESADITALFTDALDRLGIAWKRSNRNNISIARREAVARLVEFVGPKY